MPNSLQTLDTSFPKIDNHQTTEENFLQVTNYLYMLLENLRYTLGNLGAENFNDTELDSIGYWIRQPVMVRLEDTEGHLASLDIEASKISARLEDAEGNINLINTTATGYYARIESAEGDINSLNITVENLSSQISGIDGAMSSIQQTSNALMLRVQTAEGNISTLTQTAESLSSKISDAEGNISGLTQTVSGISTRVSDTEGNVSTLQQTVKGMSLSVSNGASSSTISLVQDGVAISSKTISLSGMVTFSDLSTKGSTTINGSNITTGSINASLIKTGSLDASAIDMSGLLKLSYNSSNYGWMGYNSDKGGPAISGGNMNAFIVVTNTAAKISHGDTSNVYTTNGHVGFQFGGKNIKYTGGAFYSESAATLGTSSYKWGQGYSTASTFNTSDRNQKHDIEDLDERYLALFDRLRPVRYKFNDGTSGRFHVGFIAQEVEDAMTLSGIDSREFGGFGKDVHAETGEDIYMLRYEEFIGMMAAKMQRMDERVKELEVSA